MVNTPEELGAWLRLSLTPGVGNESARKLLAAFGPPDRIFAQTESALRQVVSATQARHLLNTPDGWAELNRETWEWLQSTHAQGVVHAVVTLGDTDYPASLLRIPDPPLMLYALGFWWNVARHVSKATQFLIRIDQPRCAGGGGEWRISLEDLLKDL